jgi:hypothetical protein
MKERNLLLAVAALVIVIAAAFALSSPRGSRLKVDEGATSNETAARAPELDGPSRTATQLCSSSAGFQQLKAAAFQEAIRVRGEPAILQRLAASSVVRMENPALTSEDSETGAATCAGRLVIELPPGAERGFGGQRRLAADVEYTAQPGANGGAAVYRLVNADALVSSLAAFDVDSSLQPAQSVETELADATPAEELPVIIRPDPPAPRPEPTRSSPQPARVERENRRRARRPRPPSSCEGGARESSAAAGADPSRSCSRNSGTTGAAHVAAELQLRFCAEPERALDLFERPARGKGPGDVSLFFSALNDANPRTRRELERTRNRFLNYRERCSSEACISEAYDGRIQEIRISSN